MKKQTVSMGMPVTIAVCDRGVTQEDILEVFSYFRHIDNKFSTYKKNSEISQVNRGEIGKEQYSNEMKKILRLCEETKKQTDGYFDINKGGILDPSGIVKGYAILEGAKILKNKGFKNFYVEIAGDIQTYGRNSKNQKWSVGIQNPFSPKEIVKVVKIENRGIATSGNYVRGNHIYNPKNNKTVNEIVSLSVIGPDVFEADRFATAAFSMGERGIEFIENMKGFEGYQIRKDKKAVFTSGFGGYL